MKLFHRQVAADWCGEPEATAAETERHDLDGVGVGVEQHVAAGDADVERALPDVDRDIAGSKIEELDTVRLVEECEFLRVGALQVARLPEHLSCWLRQRALVGDGDL